MITFVRSGVLNDFLSTRSSEYKTLNCATKTEQTCSIFQTLTVFKSRGPKTVQFINKTPISLLHPLYYLNNILSSFGWKLTANLTVGTDFC